MAARCRCLTPGSGDIAVALSGVDNFRGRTQKPGLGFPIARVVALLCLHSGAALDMVIGPYQGKRTGENALFRSLFGQLCPGDVVAGDCGFGSFWNFAMLQARGVDAIFPLHQCRPEDFRRGKRLGKDDRLIEWRKPKRPQWMDRQTYQSMPDTLMLRQVRVRIEVPGFRVRTLVLVTTLLDPRKYPKEELAQVYRARWHAELDLRSIKCAMQMDVLRAKSPDMVRKECWMRLLAYNLIRGVMAQAATLAPSLTPRELSFTGAMQTLNAFAPLALSRGCDPAVYAALLRAIASHRVGDRPNRVEPRAVKRRPKPHAMLTEPRQQAQSRLLRAA
jgi:hypothetical protein